MSLILENTIAGLIILVVFYFSIQMVIRRVISERELINIISSKLTLEKYKKFEDKELKDFILIESKELMDIKDYTISTYPFIQDSLYGQTAYMKRFREQLEKSLTEDVS